LPVEDEEAEAALVEAVLVEERGFDLSVLRGHVDVLCQGPVGLVWLGAVDTERVGLHPVGLAEAFEYRCFVTVDAGDARIDAGVLEGGCQGWHGSVALHHENQVADGLVRGDLEVLSARFQRISQLLLTPHQRVVKHAEKLDRIYRERILLLYLL